MIYENCEVVLVSPNSAWEYDGVTVDLRDDGIYHVVKPQGLTNLRFDRDGRGADDRDDSGYGRYLRMRDGKPLQAVIGYGEGI